MSKLLCSSKLPSFLIREIMEYLRDPNKLYYYTIDIKTGKLCYYKNISFIINSKFYDIISEIIKIKSLSDYNKNIIVCLNNEMFPAEKYCVELGLYNVYYGRGRVFYAQYTRNNKFEYMQFVEYSTTDSRSVYYKFNECTLHYFDEKKMEYLSYPVKVTHNDYNPEKETICFVKQEKHCLIDNCHKYNQIYENYCKYLENEMSYKKYCNIKLEDFIEKGYNYEERCAIRDIKYKVFNQYSNMYEWSKDKIAIEWSKDKYAN